MNVHVLSFESSLMRLSKVMGRRYDVNETPVLTVGEEWHFGGRVVEDEDDKSVD